MKTILIADEDSRLVNVLRLVFAEHEGYRVFAASGGADAVSRAKEIIPDIVIVDVSLSNQNGHKVSREIKNDPSLENTSVILLGSAFMASDKRKAFEVHADEVIIKPFEPDELINKVEFLINRREEKQTKSGLLVQAERHSENSNTGKLEADGEEVDRRKESWRPESFKPVPPLLADSLKTFYLACRSYAGRLTTAVMKLKDESLKFKPSIKLDFVETMKLDLIKIPSPDLSGRYTLIKLWLVNILETFAFLLNRSYRIAKSYAEGFGFTAGGIKGLTVASRAFLKTGFSEAPVPISVKRHSPFALISLLLILSIAILVVFANEEKGDVSSITVSKSPVPTSTANSGIGTLFPEYEDLGKVSDGVESETENVEDKEVLKGETAKSSLPEKNVSQKGSGEAKVKKSASKTKSALKDKPRGGKYVVKRGDTLSGIAERFDTSTGDLRIVNNIRGDRIYAGTVLIIPDGVVRREVTRWDTVGAGADADFWGIRLIDWSFYVPWSGVAVIHHVFIENSSDVDYKSIKVKLYYHSDSAGRTGRNEITATLPVTVPRNSKKIYLKEGVMVRGNFGSMNVRNDAVEVVGAVPDRGPVGYSLR